MADGRRRELWQHTAAAIAMNFNAHRMSKTDRVYSPEDFDPYAQDARRRAATLPGGFEVLKQVLGLAEQPQTTTEGDRS